MVNKKIRKSHGSFCRRFFISFKCPNFFFRWSQISIHRRIFLVVFFLFSFSINAKADKIDGFIWKYNAMNMSGWLDHCDNYTVRGWATWCMCSVTDTIKASFTLPLFPRQGKSFKNYCQKFLKTVLISMNDKSKTISILLMYDLSYWSF